MKIGKNSGSEFPKLSRQISRLYFKVISVGQISRLNFEAKFQG